MELLLVVVLLILLFGGDFRIGPRRLFGRGGGYRVGGILGFVLTSLVIAWLLRGHSLVVARPKGWS